MAGRGRPNTSLTHEQMSSLGLVAKDLSGQTITGPPPVFPQLMSKPVPLESGAARDYKILWKEDFISFLKDSPYYTHPAAVRDTAKVQRYSDKYVNSSKRDQFAGADFNWSRLPAELRPNYKRKPAVAAAQATGKRKRAGSRAVGANATAAGGLSVEEKLRKLEEKENGAEAKEAAGGSGGGVGDAANTTRGAADSDAEDEQLDEDEQQDEEMDDENDYGNSYFDNGDAYNEEDDNLDDGPVY